MRRILEPLWGWPIVFGRRGNAPELLLFALGAYLGTEVGLWFSLDGASTALSLFGGIAVWAAIRNGWQGAAATAAGAIPAYMHLGAPVAVGLGASLFVGSYLVHWLMQYAEGEPFQHPRWVVAFITSLTAGAAVHSLLAQGILALVDVRTLYTTWHMGYATSAAVFGAVLMSVPYPGRHLSKPAEQIASLIGLILVGLFVFTQQPINGHPATPMAFLPAVPLAWVAFRSGGRLATFATMALVVLAVQSTWFGSGPFALEPDYRVASVFGAAMAILSLTISASQEQRLGILEDLEKRVEERTHNLQEAVVALEEEATRRRSAQEAADETLSKLREAQRIGGIGSWHWDVRNDKVTWSDELYRIYGLERSQIPASYEAYLQSVHPEDRDRVNQNIQKSFESHAPFAFSHRVHRPNSEERWIQSRGVVKADENGVISMQGTVQDLTERVQAQEAEQAAADAKDELDRLTRLDKFKTEFLNMAAHELGTPLTPILLQLNIMERRARPEVAERLVVVKRNVHRLAAIVEDMLETARLQAGTLVLDRAEVNLKDLATEAVDTFMTPAKAKGLNLELHGEDVLVYGDSKRLEHVMVNLVSNAVKFTPKGSIEVRIEARPIPRIEVRDTGAGLTHAQMHEIFQPFTRAHPDLAHGTGLGLSICKGIVEAHGGYIEVTSDGPGKGSCFVVELPAPSTEEE